MSALSAHIVSYWPGHIWFPRCTLANTETQKASARDPIIGLVPKNLVRCEYASAVPKRKGPLQVYQRPHSAGAAATSCRTPPRLPAVAARRATVRSSLRAGRGRTPPPDATCGHSARWAGAAEAAHAVRLVSSTAAPSPHPLLLVQARTGRVGQAGRPCSSCPGPDGCAEATTAPESRSCRPDESQRHGSDFRAAPTSSPKHSIAAAGRGTASRARPGRLRSWSGSAARARLDLLPASISGPQKPVSPGIAGATV